MHVVQNEKVEYQKLFSAHLANEEKKYKSDKLERVQSTANTSAMSADEILQKVHSIRSTFGFEYLRTCEAEELTRLFKDKAERHLPAAGEQAGDATDDMEDTTMWNSKVHTILQELMADTSDTSDNCFWLCRVVPTIVFPSPNLKTTLLNHASQRVAVASWQLDSFTVLRLGNGKMRLEF